MIYTVFDLETTGLYDFNKIDVIQCAYIRLNNDFQPIRSECMFYYYEGMDWSQDAENVHHISQDFLRGHKDEFFDNLKRMYINLNNSFFITFNGDKYDIPLATRWLNRMSSLNIESLGSYDVMKIYGKVYGRNPSLIKACEKEGITPEIIQIIQNQLFGVASGSHDSTYDTVATYLLFKKAIADGKIVLREESVSKGSWETEPDCRFFRICDGQNISYVCTSANTKFYEVIEVPESEVDKVIASGEFKDKHLSPELIEKLIVSKSGNLVLNQVAGNPGVYEQSITEHLRMVLRKTVNYVTVGTEAM